MKLDEYIEIVAGKRFGQPCIINTRISVYDILSWLANGMTFDEIVSDYPELSVDQIKAALFFAAEREHQMKIAS